MFLYAQKLREDRGLAPILYMPKGIPQSQLGCPMSRATGLQFSHNQHYSPGKHKEGTDNPDYVKEFLASFDRGECPALIESVFLKDE